MNTTTTKIRPELAEVLLQNYKRFHKYIQSRIGNPSDAEDILQQSLLKALKLPASSVRETSIISWFYRILKNTLTDYYRAKSSYDKRNPQQTDEDMMGASGSLKAKVCECLYGILPTLNPGYEELIRKIDLEDQDPVRVAAELGISRNNLDVKLYRARRALKKSLEAMCGACTEHSCLDCSCKASKNERFRS